MCQACVIQEMREALVSSLRKNDLDVDDATVLTSLAYMVCYALLVMNRAATVDEPLSSAKENFFQAVTKSMPLVEQMLGEETEESLAQLEVHGKRVH